MEKNLETVTVSFDEKDGVGRILMDRPDSLNALNTQLRKDIITALEQLERVNIDSDGVTVRAVILEGAGGNFSAGADINEFNEKTLDNNLAREHYETIMNYPAPVIAKISGYCLGGGFETALSCDIRIAHENSKIGLPEVDLGIVPGSGGIQFVSRLANYGIATELAMTGEHITAERAHELGIVNHIHSDSEINDAVQELAKTIAEKPPLSIQAIKQSTDMAVSQLQTARKFDRQQSTLLRNSDDYKKAVEAFSEDNDGVIFEGK